MGGQGCDWGSWLAGVTQGSSALDLAQDLGGDGRVEVDGVVPQALRGLVALAAAALEGLAHADLRAVAVLGVVLDAVHILKRRRKTYKQHKPYSETQ